MQHLRTALTVLLYGLAFCCIRAFLRAPGESETIHHGEIILPANICTRRENDVRLIAITKAFGTVLCDMATDEGGWIVILKRYNGRLSFKQNWNAYAFGFGDFSSEFWIGNYIVFLMTSRGYYDLLVDMVYRGTRYYAKYAYFRISPESSRYKLIVKDFIGGRAGDSLTYHNNCIFSTVDKNSDVYQQQYSCVAYNQVPWWYKQCQQALLFGDWGSRRTGHGVIWTTITGDNTSLDSVEMKIRFNKFHWDERLDLEDK